MRLSPSVLIISVAVLAGACTQPAPTTPVAPKPDLAVAEQMIRAADAAWLKAAQAKNAAGEAANFAADAVIVRPNNPPMNPAEFQAYAVKDYAASPQMMTNWTTETVRVNDSGDWAVQTGNYNVTGLGAKGDETDHGRFVTLWKKTDGGWRVASDTSVSTKPLPEKK